VRVKRAAAAVVAELASAQVAAPVPEMPDPCADPVMRNAPAWAKHLCAEILTLRAEVRALRMRVAGATFLGVAVAEGARLLLESL
jgi:hypothetical protein